MGDSNVGEWVSKAPGTSALSQGKEILKRLNTPAFIQIPVDKAETGQVQATLGRAKKRLKEDKEKGLLNKRTAINAVKTMGPGALVATLISGKITKSTPVKEAIPKILKHGKKGMLAGAALGGALSAGRQLRERAHKKKLIRLMKEELVKRKKKSS